MIKACFSSTHHLPFYNVAASPSFLYYYGMKNIPNLLHKKLAQASVFIILVFNSIAYTATAQSKTETIVNAIVKEANENSQLKYIGHELLDGIGPRLVGSTKMVKASDWVIAQYTKWGVTARRENYGEWRGWDRGVTHIDMVAPWTRSLEGTQLAFSPATKNQLLQKLLYWPMWPTHWLLFNGYPM